ncbi:hypothetical protein [Pseudonocardia sp. NPDC049154]|uniref:hypothetical protein n=1 Tax=Pseudonocardia sp. NPDC049154 TaxID=3155501 RepID=UPI0033ED11D6
MSGSTLHSARPDSAVAEALGGDLMDAANAFRALEAGLAQGALEADTVARFWRA